jgi:hypothetical protein
MDYLGDHPQEDYNNFWKASERSEDGKASRSVTHLMMLSLKVSYRIRSRQQSASSLLKS